MFRHAGRGIPVVFFLKTWGRAQSLPNTVHIISEHKIIEIQILDDSVF